jgi:predicted ABC-type ATPase
MAPSVYIVAGSNGAGKTTFAQTFLPRYANCKNFINADLIARGLSPLAPEAAAFRAGRLVLGEIRRFANLHTDFSFESTLAGTSYLSLIRLLRVRGYSVGIFFLWLSSVDLALARIHDRVLRGGHDVPERRFGGDSIVPSGISSAFTASRRISGSSSTTRPPPPQSSLLRIMEKWI